MLPLVEELVPCPDPWEVARKLSHLPHLLFLDSAARSVDRGRYSYITADPYGTAATRWTGLEQMARRASRVELVPNLPPFQGGYAGIIGYEHGQYFDRVPAPQIDEFRLPPFVLFHYDRVIAFDHQQHQAWIVSTGDVGTDWPGQEDRAQKRLRDWLQLLTRPTIGPTRRPKIGTIPRNDLAAQYPLAGFPGVSSTFSREGYLAAVQRVIDYIQAGDCFQVNLAQRLLTRLTEHPLDLYGRLRAKNPAPFACYFDAGDFQIVSASPERFLKVTSSGEVVTKPIKGTRPRGQTPEADAESVRQLTTSLKDRSENVMIVDLLRNDLGRVCDFGTVTVPKVCEVESYADVHHLVSEVRGRLRSGHTPLDLLRAAFPGGSVTGAPKVRAMEIIAELEPTARGPYCGSLGYIGPQGTMDTNILIRSFTASQGWLQFPVGGGIVAESDPAREYDETLYKAAGLLRSLRLES